MHRRWILGLKALGAASVLAILAQFVPSGATSEWQTASTSGYDLHYGSGNEADAAVIGTFLKTAYARIAGEFSDHQPTDLVDGIELDVFLHPRAGEMASEQHATMTSNLARDGYKAAIHMLTPSAYKAARGDAALAGDGADYMFRQVVHEVSAVYVQRLILGKPKGWRYDQAAPWFLQGYDEYLAGIHGRRAEDATLKAYRDQVRGDPARVRFGNAIQVNNPYSDGAVLVHFLHASFGREAVHNIWLSPEPTFEAALLSALDTDYGELEARWRRWLADG